MTAAALYLAAMASNAFVVTTLWGWFVPLPAIGPAQAIGVSLLAGYMVPAQPGPVQPLSELAVNMATRMGLTLAVGWFVHLFV